VHIVIAIFNLHRYSTYLHGSVVNKKVFNRGFKIEVIEYMG